MPSWEFATVNAFRIFFSAFLQINNLISFEATNVLPVAIQGQLEHMFVK
jgi:hypothetical protein